MGIVINLLVKYIEAHPDQVINLIEAGVAKLIEHLQKPAAPAKA